MLLLSVLVVVAALSLLLKSRNPVTSNPGGIETLHQYASDPSALCSMNVFASRGNLPQFIAGKRDPLDGRPTLCPLKSLEPRTLHATAQSQYICSSFAQSQPFLMITDVSTEQEFSSALA